MVENLLRPPQPPEMPNAGRPFVVVALSLIVAEIDGPPQVKQ
jgi:hypothetical protein